MDIFEKIENKLEGLSKTQLTIANYILENKSKVPFMTINEIAKEAGVSIASVTRFTKKMDLNGFAQLNKEIQDIVKKDITPMSEIKNSIRATTDQGIILKDMIQKNIESLNNTYTEELENAFCKAIETIRYSSSIYIVASRSSFSVAYYLHFMLSQFHKDVVLLTNGTENISSQLPYIKEKDCLIAVSFSKYTRFTYNIIDYFSQKGNKVISITDSYISPIGKKSDVVLLAKNTDNTYSFVPAMTIANSIVVGLGSLDKSETLKRMKEHDDICQLYDIHI